MVDCHDFEVSEELKQCGVSIMRQEDSTFLIRFNDTPIRFDIDSKSWNKTVAGYHKYAKRLITDEELRLQIEYYLADQYITFLANGNGKACSSNNSSSNAAGNGDNGKQQKQATNNEEIIKMNWTG